MALKTVEQADRAWEAYAFIEAHPDLHDQGYWCNFRGQSPTRVTLDSFLADGTMTVCFAGAVVLLAGATIINQDCAEDPEDHQTRMIDGLAGELLGLPGYYGAYLFAPSANDLDILRARLDLVYGPRPAPVGSAQ